LAPAKNSRYGALKLVLLAALSGIAEPWTLLGGCGSGFVALVSGFLFGRMLRAPNDPPATRPAGCHRPLLGGP
jgi:hypothetical protein